MSCTVRTGQIGMDEEGAAALAGLRRFNYERIYTRPESVAQAQAVIAVLRGLVDHYLEHPGYPYRRRTPRRSATTTHG